MDVKNSVIFGTLAIVVHPWMIELYLLLKNNETNPFHKLYSQHNLDVERVVDLLMTKSGLLYYFGENGIIYDIDLRKTTKSKFKIMDNLKKERDQNFLNILYKKIITKISQALPYHKIEPIKLCWDEKDKIFGLFRKGSKKKSTFITIYENNFK